MVYRKFSLRSGIALPLRSTRQRYLVEYLLMLAVLCVWIDGCFAYEESDFDFEDKQRMVPSETLLDDEDLMSDQGSGPIEEPDHSGTVETKTHFPFTPTKPAFPATSSHIPDIEEIDQYRSTINFTSVRYSAALNNNSSAEFIRHSHDIKAAVESVFKQLHGQQRVNIVQFSPSPGAPLSTLVTLDIRTYGFYDGLALFNSLNNAVNRRSLGSYSISPIGFQFQPHSVLDPDSPQPKPTCAPHTQFQCNNGACIDAERKCNDIFDCTDRSDEYNCPLVTTTVRPAYQRCFETQFRCSNGLCIEERHRCDGRADCPEEEDENVVYCEDCPVLEAPPGAWVQKNGNKLTVGCDLSGETWELHCQRRKWVGVWGNCTQRDGLPRLCSSADFQCKDGSCVPEHARCNGKYDCYDRSDEFDCDEPPSSRLCASWEFRCGDGRCIDRDQLCNHQYDCHDQSDEANCETISLSATPKELKIREGVTATFVCHAQGSPIPQVRWSRAGLNLPPTATDDYNGRLTIPDASLSESGDYICSTLGAFRPYEARVTLHVELVYGPTQVPTGPRHCHSADDFMCNNRACIPSDYRCDGDYDCTDHSDEANCRDELVSCEPNEFKCTTSNKCILKIWVCDGDDDCGGDRSDETDCDALPRRRNCRSDEFQCITGQQCIPAGFQCDSEKDCHDGSDESGCSRPTAVKVPPKEIMVQQGDRIVIDCEAIGIPPPLVIWRLNWGHVGQPPRVSTTSDRIDDRPGLPVTARGVLTIESAQKEDEGAYTCEALNSMGSIFIVPDTIVHVLPPSGICPRGYFNADARSQSECIHCFCFGLAGDCTSSSLFLSEISIGNSLEIVDRLSQRPLESPVYQYDGRTRHFIIYDYSRTVHGSGYYWSLPKQFLGNKVTSYGGKLRFTVSYSLQPRRQSTSLESGPDVILSGNGITLYQTTFYQPFSGSEQMAAINLREDGWSLDEQGVQRATRENLMIVLQNLNYILIKSSYERDQQEARLSGISMTVTTSQSTSLGRAFLVEQCSCPVGYTGPSCEQCSPGFRLTEERGQYIGQCSGCNCLGHSNDCDPRTGLCRECQHNTEGERCERCNPGFYGDPRHGTSLDCRPCPCPPSDGPEVTASECYVEDDGEVSCQNCPLGHVGRRCEACSLGYGKHEDGVCRPEGLLCDPKGTDREAADPHTGQCHCKPFTMGPTCSQCKRNTFYPAISNPNGCISCFCMGVNASCTSTTWNRAQVTVTFYSDTQGFVLSDRGKYETFTDGITVDRQKQEIKFRNFHELPANEYFWSLPTKFLGNKLTSYGGNLRFTIQHLPGLKRDPTHYPDVEIGGNDIVLEYVHDQPIRPNHPTVVSVPFFENYWKRADGTVATREHLMMVLANLDFILIKAKFTEDVAESSIKDVSLDVAENKITGQEHAYTVEECLCPPGYRGLSCEVCDIGYRRSGGGLYLGTCELCDCFGHSSECDTTTGMCKNCQHYTAGERCDVCASGYYGDATRGHSNDCQPCPCPLSSAPNQFSQECYLDKDSQVTCAVCPPGYAGRQCERCEPGYSGNPRQPGGACTKESENNLPKVTVTPERQSSSVGGSVTFQCNVGGHGPFNIDWMRADGRPLPLNRAVVGRDNSLRITDLHPTDSGRYICVAVNAYGRSQLDADLSVNDDRHLQVIVKDPKQLTAAVGSDVILQCVGISPNVFTLAWTRKDGRLWDSRIMDDGLGKLTIKGLRREDQGAYICTGSDFYDLATDEAYLTIRELPGFEVLINEPDLKIGQGEEARMDCSAKSHIEVEKIEWTKYDSRLPPGAYQNGGQLIIPECQPDYSGRYVCTIYLVNGEKKVAYSSLTITEDKFSRVEAPHATMDSMARTISEGETIEIRCSVTGSPPPTIAWSRSRGAIKQNHRIYGNILRIVDATYADSDTYICEASNSVGSSRATAAIQVERVDAPLLDIYPSDVVDVKAGESALFQCLASHRLPGATITWRRAGNERFTHNTEVMEGSGSIRFFRVTGAEQGSYICTAVSNGEFTSATATLRVQDMIRVAIKPSTAVRLVAGQKLVAECVVQGSATNAYWETPLGAVVHGTPSLVILEIPSVTSHDSGKYRCIAKNSFDEVEDLLHVTVTGFDVSWTTFSPDRQHVSAVVRPQEILIALGQTAEFRCSSSGSPAAVLLWTKVDGLMPHTHVARDGLLRIERVSESDAGTYKCIARSQYGSGEVTVQLHVIVPPVISISPTTQTLRPGDVFRIQCTALGTKPINIEWSKLVGSLSPHARDYQGLLEIASVTAADAGRYRCIASSDAGRAESLAELIILAPPGAIVSPRSIHVGSGHTAEFYCAVTGSPSPRIQWSKVGGNLPEQHSVEGGTLTLFNVQPHDKGRYVCLVVNEAGTTRDYGELSVAGKDNHVPVQDRKETLTVGDRVEINCEVTGEPRPTVKWIKVNGAMSSHILLEDTFLIIPSVAVEDQGTYRCVASSVSGTVYAQVTLIVAVPPNIPVSRQSRTVSTGGRAVLTCHARGEPVPSVQWSKRGGPLPRNHEAENGILVIPVVRPEDFGEYICAARNQYGFAEGVIVLQSGELIPYFAQNPVSYLSYPTIQDAYKTFDVEISFKPQSVEGLILYNGQLDDGTGDFVSFGLRNRRAELRLDVGSGPAIITTDPVVLDTWHTVTIKRDGKDASIFLNGREYKGQAPGSFIGLDLTENMYVGAVPDFRRISHLAGYTKGFIGCISRLMVNGVPVNLGSEVLDNNGVTDCPVCQYRPCRNGGTCHAARTEFGYECLCARNYSGANCELIGERCVAGVCGRMGKCTNLEKRVGYQCSCPLGITGQRCEQGSRVATPLFNSSSFIAYPTLRDARFDISLKLTFSANSASNALLLYNGFSHYGDGDFVAISIKDGYVHFQYDSGTGLADIQSRESIRVGEWTTVLAERSYKDGSLSINNGVAVKGSAPEPDRGTSYGETVGLDLKTNLFIGGISNVRVSPAAGILTGFDGCISELVINDVPVDLVNEAISFRHILDCGAKIAKLQSHPCASQLCHNNGTCMEHEGQPDSFVCSCADGFTGKFCENHHVLLGKDVQFNGIGYLELAPELLPHASPLSPEIIEFNVTTLKANALLFWHGQHPTTPGHGHDYISVALENGQVVFSYELGSGPANIISKKEINDGGTHHIKIQRTGRQGILELDTLERYTGESGGEMTGLNTVGNIYLGGLPDYRTMTGGKYSHGLVGCIADLYFDHVEPVDFTQDAIGGINILPCSS